MRLRRVVPAVLIPLLLAVSGAGLTGCGASGTVRLTGHRLALALSEYRITPQNTSVGPGRLRIVARNRGILPHNVELQRGTLDSSERTTLAVILTLLPGASGSVETQPLAPGHYLLLSTVGNQAVLGMAGTLVVR
jgi:hypothetical protein